MFAIFGVLLALPFCVFAVGISIFFVCGGVRGDFLVILFVPALVDVPWVSSCHFGLLGLRWFVFSCGFTRVGVVFAGRCSGFCCHFGVDRWLLVFWFE